MSLRRLLWLLVALAGCGEDTVELVAHAPPPVVSYDAARPDAAIALP